jgi:hypothetical protein
MEGIRRSFKMNKENLEKMYNVLSNAPESLTRLFDNGSIRTDLRGLWGAAEAGRLDSLLSYDIIGSEHDFINHLGIMEIQFLWLTDECCADQSFEGAMMRLKYLSEGGKVTEQLLEDMEEWDKYTFSDQVGELPCNEESYFKDEEELEND